MLKAITRNTNFFGLLSANTILGAAMPMLIILGGLAGIALAPAPTFATFPPSVQILAGLLATGPFSWVMGRYGRRTGFLIGGSFAIIGGVISSAGLFESSFVLLCLGHMFLGGALASYQYFRFAAAETVSERWTPVAVSLMLTSGLVAALAGPQLFIITKDIFSAAPLAGAYAAISALTIVGLCPLAAVRIKTPTKKDKLTRSNQATTFSVLCRKPVLSAIIVGAASQAVMVLLMAPTPLAMVNHGFSEAVAGDVIRWHVVAMFAPSFFTGFLIQKVGTMPVAIFGLLTMIASSAIAATGLTPHHFYGSLILLGIGWNFGFIGATNMLVNTVESEEKSLVQGVNDTAIALASTVVAFAGGAVVARYGWTILSVTAIPILLLALLSLLPKH